MPLLIGTEIKQPLLLDVARSDCLCLIQYRDCSFGKFPCMEAIGPTFPMAPAVSTSAVAGVRNDHLATCRAANGERGHGAFEHS